MASNHKDRLKDLLIETACERYHRKRLIKCYIDDFESHVYFPRELRLLFLHTGFEIEDFFGDYSRRPLRPSSQIMIMTGRKPGEASNDPVTPAES